VLLAADLLFRAAELENLQVLMVLASDGGVGKELDALTRSADALGIHPPTARVGPGEAEAALGGLVDVHVTPRGTQRERRPSGTVIAVGPVRRPGATSQDAAARLADPLAVRLALMMIPADEEADLTDEALARAGETLMDWRRRVAEWAQSPSRPVPANLADAVRVAFGDLDTVSLIALIDDLAADDGVPSGARFETFLYADRVLGLELPRDIGRLSV